MVASTMTSASQSESTLWSESALTNEREQALTALRTTRLAASVMQSVGPTATQLTANSLRPQGNSLSSQAVSGTTVPGQLAPVVSVTNLLRSADRLAASQGLVAAQPGVTTANDTTDEVQGATNSSAKVGHQRAKAATTKPSSSVIALVRAMLIALLKKDQDEDDENDESELD